MAQGASSLRAGICISIVQASGAGSALAGLTPELFSCSPLLLCFKERPDDLVALRKTISF